MPGFCYDKRILGGLAVAGAGVLVFTPQLILTALPLLLLAACPLSMLLMGRAMMGHGQRTSNAPVAASGPATPIDVPYEVRAVDADPGAQTAALRSQLEQLEAQQALLAQQIAALEATHDRPGQPLPTTPGRMGAW